MRDMPQQRHTPLNQNKKVSSYFLISELFTKLKSQARQIPITKANFLKIDSDGYWSVFWKNAWQVA